MKKTSTYKPLRSLVLLTLFAMVVAILTSSRGADHTFPYDRILDPATAAANVPLLLIDPVARRMELSIADQPVWEAQFHYGGANDGNFEDFFASLIGSAPRGIATVESRHLYSGRGQYGEHELAVVADEINVEPTALQRTFPGRFALVWPGGYVLEVTTGIDASPLSRWDNLCFDVLRFVGAPFGERCLYITMDSTAALTLYDVARPGLPVFICTSAKGL